MVKVMGGIFMEEWKDIDGYVGLYQISNQNISKCCRGRLKSAGKHPVTGEKLKWEYVE